jgi:DNA mismatch repair protein MutS
MQVSQDLRHHLQNTFKADPLHDEIDYVADGVDPEIDELRVIAYHSDDLLLAYQQALIAHTGVSNVKVKYTNNQ